MSIELSLTKKYRDFMLNTAFSSSAHGVTGLLGVSGSGKSMTLRCIAGIVKPDSGRIVVGNTVFFDSEARINLKPQQRNVGYLFQNYALFPNMTVRQNILAGIPKKQQSEQELADLIRRFDLAPLIDRYPDQLSGGQQQRTALARILIRRPSILLLDEPFSALDTSLRWTLQQELLKLLDHYDGTTLFVSHSRDEIFMLCDEAGVMENGSIVSFGSIDSLFAHPKSRASLKLTGVKNISAVRQVAENTYYSDDWQLSFRTEDTADADTAGIRAHYFYPCAPDAVNAIEIEVVRTISFPFNVSVLFKPKGTNPKHLLCWDITRDDINASVLAEYPQYLAISPKNISLTRG